MEGYYYSYYYYLAFGISYLARVESGSLIHRQLAGQHEPCSTPSANSRK
jgi:hypothetical protein